MILHYILRSIMNLKNSILGIFFFINLFVSTLVSAEIDNTHEMLNPSVRERVRGSDNYDLIQEVALPTLHLCKHGIKALSSILFDSIERRMIGEHEIQCVRVGFLPFYTNFWCTGVRISIEILAESIYSRRDCQRYKCETFDENHKERVRKFMEKTHFLLKGQQESLESKIILGHKLTIQWTEMAIEGSILFLENL